jgi:pSer/pThr/pTyr-binding forkhead associated (FHA) protein
MLTLVITVATVLTVLLIAAAAAMALAGRRNRAAGAREPRRAGPRPAAGNGPAVGSLTCTAGPLAGQQFPIGTEGVYIGRDGSLSQVVIDDDRVSKRHVWVGPRGNKVTAVDQGSTNGTFLNAASNQRITEVFLNPGDTVILSEDVARFQFQK